MPKETGPSKRMSVAQAVAQASTRQGTSDDEVDYVHYLKSGVSAYPARNLQLETTVPDRIIVVIPLHLKPKEMRVSDIKRTIGKIRKTFKSQAKVLRVAHKLSQKVTKTKVA